MIINIIPTHKYRVLKALLTSLLITAHIALILPISEVFAMESANFKVIQSAVSSGGADNAGINAVIPHSNIAESAVANTESANYNASIGYMNTIVSNPPVFRGVIPDANLRIMWNKGQACPVSISLDAYFSSPDNSTLTYQVEGASGVTVSIDPITHVASFSQGPDFFGSETIRFIAIDSSGNRTKSNFVILIVKAPIGNPPVIYPITDIIANENELIHVTPVIYDPDGDTLSLAYTAPFDDSGRWQTTYNDAGKYSVTATVSDGVISASTSFSVTVKNVNRPPEIESIPGITVNEGELVELNVIAHDPDSDNVIVTYPAPFDAAGRWQSNYRDAGEYHFTVTASDGTQTATKNVDVIVNNVNVKPSVEVSTSRVTVSVNEEFTAYVVAQDPDADQLRLTLKRDGSVIAGCDGIILIGQTHEKALSIASAGSHTIEAIVEEIGVSGAPNTASHSVKINVDENSSPEVYFPISSDFNGDGLTDLGYFNRALGIWKVQLSKGGGALGAVEYWASGGFGNDDMYCYPIMSDFNGDGRTDAGFVRVPTSDGAGTYIRLAMSTGAGFNAQTANWRSANSGNMQNDWHYATFTGDFNGDGLTDIGQVRVDSNTSLYVGLTGANLGVSGMANWIQGGSHVSISDFSPIAADFNGDGLTDLSLFNKTAGRWAVTLSKGGMFGDTTDWLTNFCAASDPVLGDFNCDGFTDIGYMAKEDNQWSLKYAISDGTKFNLNNGQPYTYQTGMPDSAMGSFISGDFNGDGLFDIAVFDKIKYGWTIKLHHSKYPDILIGIDNGMGGTTAISYNDSVVYENIDSDGLPALPFSIRVVSVVTQSDGLGSSYSTQYFYRDGYFDPVEREFRGFGYVKVIDAEGSHKETYFNQDNTYKGRPAKEVVRDRYGKAYSQTMYNWQNAKLFNNLIDFPYLLDKTSIAYDPATGESKSGKSTFTYDEYGNATNVRNDGFLDETGDEQESSVAYYYDIEKWIISKPVENSVKDASGKIVAASKYYYYPNGSLQKEERWQGQAGGSPVWGSPDNPVTQFTYGASGNVETVSDARGSVTTTVYEPTGTFPDTVRNALGHGQGFTYNKATGKILTSTDPNNQVTASQYDTFGRLFHVAGPGNISEVTYSYDLTAKPAKITSTTKTASGEHVKAFSFVDGLGRQILSRVEAEYRGEIKHIVSGEAKYDSRGQVVKKYLPYYIDAPVPDDAYILPQNATPYIRYEYDAMGRNIKTIRPDNKVSSTMYGVSTIEALNENGQYARQTTDAYGRIVEIEECSGSLTNYTYDTLGNLTDTYDSATPRNHVHIDYDALGRKISMTDPDMGGFAGKSWRYYYDKVGNLTSQIDAKGQTISFEYDAINRLAKKQGLSPQGNVPVFAVMYAYDDTSKPNGVGRLSRVTDSSGTTEFFYDILGRETKTVKAVTTASYVVERTYDSLDRLVAVKYPDNSVVSYAYNKQGGIVKIGTVPAADYPYFVTSVDYNANGQIERIVYGNGTSTNYNYDPYNFRLDDLRTLDPQNGVIQDLSYNFDPIGNVISIQDSVNTNTQSFQYDDLNRLTRSTGNSYGQINYSYNSIGNLLTKGDITMEYGEAAGPHAVTAYTRNGARKAIIYDHNGNMTGKGIDSFEYDIENRLKNVLTEKAGSSFSLSLNFNAGWNYFSLPGIVPGTSGNIKDILGPIEGKYEQVSSFDTNQGEWIHYVSDVKFNQFDKFEIGKGYLIYIKEPCTLNLIGSFPVTGQASQLRPGWNLVCAPTDSEIDVSRAFKGVTYDWVAAYDGADYNYAPTALQKGKAYWIHVNSDQVWNVPLSQVETKYSYDGDGGRVWRQDGNDLTVYIGSSYELEGPQGQTPDKVTKHIFMGSTRVCSVETGSSSTHVYYYHQDHIGSSNVVTDEAGAVANILEYSPFGEVSRNTGNYSTDKRFTGKIWDTSSALYYYGARYYNPELGRFITADPTIAHPFDPQDLNRYAYCRNNPVNYTDPTGLSWWSKFWGWVCDVGKAAVSAIGSVIGGIVGGIVGGAVGFFTLGGPFGAVAGAYIGGSIGAGMGGAIQHGENPFIGGALGLMHGVLALPFVVGGYVAGGPWGAIAGASLYSSVVTLAMGGSPRDASIAGVVTFGYGAATYGAYKAVEYMSSGGQPELTNAQAREQIARVKDNLEIQNKVGEVKIYFRDERYKIIVTKGPRGFERGIGGQATADGPWVGRNMVGAGSEIRAGWAIPEANTLESVVGVTVQRETVMMVGIAEGSPTQPGGKMQYYILQEKYTRAYGTERPVSSK